MKVKFFNINMDVLSKEEALRECSSIFSAKKNGTLCFLNAHCFNIAQKNSDYRSAINQADLLLNDGVGISMATKLLKMKLKANLNGTDFIPEVLQVASSMGLKVYLLGSQPGVAEKAKEEFEKRIGGIQIVGAHDGFFSLEEEEELVREINASQAEVMVVGMGVPRQELWVFGNQQKLKNVRLAIAGGAILDYVSGTVRRAPLWMRKARIEWIFRFFTQIRRYFGRYTWGIFIFFFRVFKWTLFPRSLKERKVSSL